MMQKQHSSHTVFLTIVIGALVVLLTGTMFAWQQDWEFGKGVQLGSQKMHGSIPEGHKTLSIQECEILGGKYFGNIGDGRISVNGVLYEGRSCGPNYKKLGEVLIGEEGGVCCEGTFMKKGPRIIN